MNRWPLLTLGALLACRAGTEPREPAAAAPPAAAAEAHRATPHEGHGEAGALGAPDQVTELKDPTSGATVLAAGARLAGLRAVSVGELLKNPEAWTGKTVRLEGNVSAMCTHERAWFAIQSEDRSGGYVRVVSVPSFRVPMGSIGKRARTEGRVELVEVPREVAQHYAQEHQLAAQPRAVIVRATGAEFL